MNDFDFDAMQKKRIARGAAHMKRGSKSKKCSLPSDHMTHAEWKRRNGPVSTYKLDAPMKWDEFKNMPADLQKTYLSNLREQYGATDEMLGRMLFVDKSAVYNRRMKLGVFSKVPRAGGEQKEKREAMWQAFMNGVVGGGEKDAEIIPDEAPAEQPESCVAEDADKVAAAMAGFKTWSESLAEVEHVDVREEPKTNVKEWPKEFVIPKLVYEEDIKPLSLDELTAVFTGVFDPTAFLKWLSQLPIPEDSVRIKVEVTRK